MVLTREEAAESLKVSVRQIDRLIADGAVPVVRFGGSVRIRTSDLQKWLVAMSRPMGVREVALMLSVEPADIHKLCDLGLPAVREGAALSFYGPLVEQWRASVEPRDTIFMSIDDRARALVKELARRGVNVSLLLCELCKDRPAILPDGERGPFAASQACHLCGKAICLPHGLHWLRNGKPTKDRPDAACDRCFTAFNPSVW